jgi:hypothetical protein
MLHHRMEVAHMPLQEAAPVVRAALAGSIQDSTGEAVGHQTASQLCHFPQAEQDNYPPPGGTQLHGPDALGSVSLRPLHMLQ